MSINKQISGLILTYNEAPNIGKLLDTLKWLGEIVVVDSGSEDGTVEILEEYPNTKLYHNSFRSFAEQCNFGLSKLSSPWVLSLDADYALSDALIEEIKQLKEGSDVYGYKASFRYCIYGKPLSASLYPPRCVLYRVQGAAYRNEGHGHRVAVSGPVRNLHGIVYHDDRKPLSRWLESQMVYAKEEAEYLLNLDSSKMDSGDRLRRKIWPAPLVAFFYTLIWKRCLFDGWRGWFYVLQRTYAEVLISLHLLDRKLGLKEKEPK